MTRRGTHSGPTATARSIPDYSRGIRRSGEGIVRRGPRRHSCARRFRPSPRALGSRARRARRRREGPREVLPAERDARWWGEEEEVGSSGALGGGTRLRLRSFVHGDGEGEGIRRRDRRSADSRGPSGGDSGNGFRAGRRGSEVPRVDVSRARGRLRRARGGEAGVAEGEGGRRRRRAEPVRTRAGLGLGLGRRGRETNPREDDDARRDRVGGRAAATRNARARARRKSPNAPNTAPNTPNAAPNTPNAAPNTPTRGSFGAGRREARVTAVRTAATPTAATPRRFPRDEKEKGRRRRQTEAQEGDHPRAIRERPGGRRCASPRGAGRGRRGRRPDPPWVVPDGLHPRRSARRRSRRRVRVVPAAFLLLLRPRRREVVRESSTTAPPRRAFLAPRPATRRAVDFAAEVAADAALEAATVAFCGEPASAAAAGGDELLRGTSANLTSSGRSLARTPRCGRRRRRRRRSRRAERRAPSDKL